MIDIMFAIGMVIGLILDVIWWNINYSKYEKGFEVLEHYHFGIVLGIVGVLTMQPIFIGLMLALIIGEWTQTNQFAFGSSHFINSTLIGIGMFILLGVVIVLW